MADPHADFSNVKITVVDDADTARRVAPRCGQMLYDLIDNTFVRNMGVGVLARLHEFGALDDLGILVVAESGGKVVGVGFASYDTQKLYRTLLRKRFWMLLPAVAKSLLNPKSIKHLLRTSGYAKHEFMQGLPDAEFFYLIIDDEFQGKGVADGIVGAVACQFLDRGIEVVKFLSGGDKARAHRFAEARGATLISEVNLYAERTSRVYTFDLTPFKEQQRAAAE